MQRSRCCFRIRIEEEPGIRLDLDSGARRWPGGACKLRRRHCNKQIVTRGEREREKKRKEKKGRSAREAALLF